MCCVEVRQGKVEVKGKAKLRFGEGGETMVRTLYTNSIPYTHSYKLQEGNTTFINFTGKFPN